MRVPLDDPAIVRYIFATRDVCSACSYSPKLSFDSFLSRAVEVRDPPSGSDGRARLVAEESGEMAGDGERTVKASLFFVRRVKLCDFRGWLRAVADCPFAVQGPACTPKPADNAGQSTVGR
jgi:hypothetical protein